MQVVILAGGKGTRLNPLTKNIPKSMLQIHGKPFLEYQINSFKQQQIKDIVLCIGYLGKQIKDHFQDGAKLGVRISYSEEKERLLGTAGAIKNAQALLEKKFLLTYGDTYLLWDYSRVINYFKSFNKLALMVVYKNTYRHYKNNVILKDNLVTVYNKNKELPKMAYIDWGLSVLKNDVLSLIPDGQTVSLEEFYQELIRRKELLAFETKQRFYEIGSFKGLAEFKDLVNRKKILYDYH